MAETMTETPTTPTEGTTSSEAAATTLLSSTEPATTTAQPTDPAATATATETTKTEEPKPEGAPEKYEFAAPEGKQYDSAVLDSFSEAAKAANLTQDAATKLLESMAPALATRQQEQITAVQNGWVESSKTDKEFGGENLQANLAIAKKGLDQFASPELRKLLDESGLGNHPEVIRAFVKIGKGMSEDGFVRGNGSVENSKTVVQTLYDHPSSK